jgi:hypothetical protein
MRHQKNRAEDRIMQGLRLLALVALAALPLLAAAQGSKPNVLVIWGDDIGIWNIATTIAA